MTAQKEMTEEQRRRSERAKEGWKKRKARKQEQEQAPVEKATAPDEPDLSGKPEPVEAKVPNVKANLEKQDKADAASVVSSDLPRTYNVEDAKKLDALPESLVVHFVSDGFTTNGRVYVRGEHFGVRSRDSRAFKSTMDSLGNSWMDLTESEQIDKYDEVKFRRGPWPYASQVVSEDEYMQALAEGDREAILKLDKKKQRADINRQDENALAGF